MSGRSASLRAWGDALMGTEASCLANGSLSARSPSAFVISHTGKPATNLKTISNFAGVYQCQPPPGAIPVRVRARPRRSNSNATQPPSELPTMCAVPQPSASILRSTSSASDAEPRKNGPLAPAVVPGHGRREDFVTAGLGYLRRDVFPHVLGQYKRVQQQHRLPGTEVDRCALSHGADSKGDTGGIASEPGFSGNGLPI